MKEISRKRFDAYVGFTRDPRIFIIGEELSYYQNESQTILGVILLDKIDHDFSVVILGRDENKKFRAIDTLVSLKNISKAQEWLFKKVSEIEAAGDVVFCQGDGGNGVDLFSPTFNSSKIHPYFNVLNNKGSHCSAKKLLSEIAPHFYDIDGNFVEQFQTTGFDSRLWEIYLQCYFNEEWLEIKRNHHTPDFILAWGDDEIALEAVIVGRKDSPKLYELPKSTEEIKLETKDNMPLRYGSPLNTKLTHKTKHKGKELHYWELEHTKGKPFVIAIADFHECFSMMWSTTSLTNYLYGQRQTWYHNKNGKLIIKAYKVSSHIKETGAVIPSGFFYQLGVENISAILHSTSGTLSKFNRMGKQCGFDDVGTHMLRRCAVHNHDPNAAEPHFITYEVSEETNETWGEGITIYHNPNAKFPLPFDFFRSAAQCFIEKGKIKTLMPPIYVYSSATLLLTTRNTAGEDSKK